MKFSDFRQLTASYFGTIDDLPLTPVIDHYVDRRNIAKLIKSFNQQKKYSVGC